MILHRYHQSRDFSVFNIPIPVSFIPDCTNTHLISLAFNTREKQKWERCFNNYFINLQDTRIIHKVPLNILKFSQQTDLSVQVYEVSRKRMSFVSPFV